MRLGAIKKLVPYYKRAYSFAGLFLHFWTFCTVNYIAFSDKIPRFWVFVLLTGAGFLTVLCTFGYLDLTRGTYNTEITELVKNNPFYMTLIQALYNEAREPETKQLLEEWLD